MDLIFPLTKQNCIFLIDTNDLDQQKQVTQRHSFRQWLYYTGNQLGSMEHSPSVYV